MILFASERSLRIKRDNAHKVLSLVLVQKKSLIILEIYLTSFSNLFQVSETQ